MWNTVGQLGLGLDVGHSSNPVAPLRQSTLAPRSIEKRERSNDVSKQQEELSKEFAKRVICVAAGHCHTLAATSTV